MLPVHPALADVDRMVFESDLVAIGAFRCPASHARFTDSGPIRNHCFVFPRTSAEIAPSGHRAFVADRAMITVYNAGQEYRRRAVAHDSDCADYYAIAPDVLRSSLAATGRFDPSHGFPVSHLRTPPALYRIQRELFNAIVDGPAVDRLVVEERVIALLDAVVAAIDREHDRPRAPATEAHHDLADRARTFLARRFARPLSLRQIAAALDSSPFHLCRTFRDVTGTTIGRHRDALRLSAALAHLESARDLSDIALEVGYSSHSHFTQAFRRAFGVTPRELRRRANGDRALARVSDPLNPADRAV